METKYRYHYYLTDYGIITSLGIKYRIGQVRTMDNKGDTASIVYEKPFCIQTSDFENFKKFITSLKSHYPMCIQFGDYNHPQLNEIKYVIDEIIKEVKDEVEREFNEKIKDCFKFPKLKP